MSLSKTAKETFQGCKETSRWWHKVIDELNLVTNETNKREVNEAITAASVANDSVIEAQYLWKIVIEKARYLESGDPSERGSSKKEYIKALEDATDALVEANEDTRHSPERPGFDFWYRSHVSSQALDYIL